MEPYIQYSYSFGNPMRPLEGRVEEGSPSRIVRTSLKGHRFVSIAISAALDLRHQESMAGFIDWLLAAQGCIAMGGTQLTEPKGNRIVVQGRNLLYLTVIARCAQDLTDTAEMLRIILANLNR